MNDLFEINKVFVAINNDLLFLMAKQPKEKHVDEQALTSIDVSELKFNIGSYIQQYWSNALSQTKSNKNFVIQPIDTRGSNHNNNDNNNEASYIVAHHFGNLLIGLIVTRNGTEIQTRKKQDKNNDDITTTVTLTTNNDEKTEMKINESLKSEILNDKEKFLLGCDFEQFCNVNVFVMERFYQIINFIYCQLLTIFKDGLISCIDDNIDFMDIISKITQEYKNRIKLLKCDYNVLKEKIKPIFKCNLENINGKIRKLNEVKYKRCIMNPKHEVSLVMGNEINYQSLVKKNSLHCILIGCDDGGDALNQFRSYLMTGIPDSQVCQGGFSFSLVFFVAIVVVIFSFLFF